MIGDHHGWAAGTTTLLLTALDGILGTHSPPRFRQLTDTVGAFIDSWNDHSHPFVWTKDAEEVPGKIQRAKTKASALTNH